MTSKQHINGGASLLEHLRVLQPFLEGDGVTEVVINKPGEVITEGKNGWTFHDVPSLDFAACADIAKLTATFSKQSFDERHPIVSATLPHGERIQIVRPPATLQNRLSLTIRKPADVIRTLDDYERDGAFDQIITDSVGLRDFEIELIELKKARKFKEFLTLAIKQRQNIIISGSTGSGKTTFMRSLLQLVPDDERLITIENVDELKLYQTHRNVVPLFYSAGGQGIADITQQHLLESSLRMKPDRIFCAELIRGDEAFYYLRNVNSGHPGSITSMHGTNPRMAIEQLVLFIKESKSGGSMSRDDIKQLLFSCIDVIVQFQNHQGRRYISEIYYEPEYKQRLLVA
ncbi:P-type DNA transfer ATPase VirB11 [Erwinia amylovora]|nr:P-type DNA transfer ATPase VirB11 [Erwinia amylovora]